MGSGVKVSGGGTFEKPTRWVLTIPDPLDAPACGTYRNRLTRQSLGMKLRKQRNEP